MRDTVLDAVRTALGPDVANEGGPSAWVPPDPPMEDPVAVFCHEAGRVQAEVQSAGPDWVAALGPLVDMFRGVISAPSLDPAALGLPQVDARAAAADPEGILGIAGGSWAIAESGSVVVDEDGAHGPSLLTETSVLLIRRDRILPRLADLPPPGPDVRTRILVTGPSRTADIEKRLVLGAHGPKRLLVLVTDDP